MRLADLFTLGNLACGVGAIFVSYSQNWVAVLGLLVLAGICDVLDGLAARWQGGGSALGKELDSLADLVSFGVAPAFLLYNYLRMQLELVPGWAWLYPMIVAPFGLPLFVAWRLARYNVETVEDTFTHFSGLPAPAQGLFWAFWIYLMPTGFWLTPIGWLGLILGLALLLVSRWPCLALKKPRSIWLYLLLLGAGWFLIGLLAPNATGLVGGLGWYLLVSYVSKKRPLQDSNLRPSG